MGSYDLIVQSVLIAQGIEFKPSEEKKLKIFYTCLFQQKEMDVSKLMKRFMPSLKIIELVIISEHELDKFFSKAASIIEF